MHMFSQHMPRVFVRYLSLLYFELLVLPSELCWDVDSIADSDELVVD